jgi:hypothetical protein
LKRTHSLSLFPDLRYVMTRITMQSTHLREALDCGQESASGLTVIAVACSLAGGSGIAVADGSHVECLRNRRAGNT